MQADEVIIHNWTSGEVHRGIRRDGIIFVSEKCNIDQIERKSIVGVVEGHAPHPELERCGHCWPKATA